jgi:hypothetical protein
MQSDVPSVADLKKEFDDLVIRQKDNVLKREKAFSGKLEDAMAVMGKSIVEMSQQNSALENKLDAVLLKLVEFQSNACSKHYDDVQEIIDLIVSPEPPHTNVE